MRGKIETKLTQNIEELIKVIATSPLVFSKSMILQELLYKAKDIFDYKSELNYIIRYVKEQFVAFSFLYNHDPISIPGAKERFLYYFNNASKSESDETKILENIKKENEVTFVKLLKKYTDADESKKNEKHRKFERDKLIKNEDLVWAFKYKEGVVCKLCFIS